MPVARSSADLMCLAVYTLAGGNVLRGFMVTTVAQRLGIPFDQATDMADAAHRAGLLKHKPAGSVSLTAKGQTLTGRGHPLSCSVSWRVTAFPVERAGRREHIQ